MPSVKSPKKSPRKVRPPKRPKPTLPEPRDPVSFVLLEKPHPKGRPRFFARGKFVQVYTDAKTAAYEKLVAKAGIDAFGDRAPFAGPLHVNLSFVMPRPKAASKRAFHVSRPDVDNLTKAVLDGLNEVAYLDDAQIVTMEVRKTYETPGLLRHGVIIQIIPLNSLET